MPFDDIYSEFFPGVLAFMSGRLLDAAQQELWKDEDVLVDPSGKLIVRIGENYLVPGEYALEVTAYGGTSGEEERTATYPFLISHPAP